MGNISRVQRYKNKYNLEICGLFMPKSTSEAILEIKNTKMPKMPQYIKISMDTFFINNIPVTTGKSNKADVFQNNIKPEVYSFDSL